MNMYWVWQLTAIFALFVVPALLSLMFLMVYLLIQEHYIEKDNVQEKREDDINE